MDALGTLAPNLTGEIDLPGFKKNSQWIRQSFIAPLTGGQKVALAMDPTDITNRFFSSAAFKYTDTAPGGNFCINPPPQFTPYADIPVPGALPEARFHTIPYSRAPSGMGRYYSEAIDDNNQNVYLRFGVPSYNSLIQFFTGFYSSSSAVLARTGRLDDSFVTKFLKFGAFVIGMAIMPLTIIPILFNMAGMAIKFLLKIPSSKFYYLKPTMPAYWHAVTSMFNQISVNKGLVKYTAPEIFQSFVGEQMKVTNMDKDVFHQIFPEFSTNGTLDVYAVANRAKRLERRHNAEMLRRMKDPGADGWYGRVRKVYQEGGVTQSIQQAQPGETSPFRLTTFWDKWLAAKDLAAAEKDSMIEKDIRKGADVSTAGTVEEAMSRLKQKWTSSVSASALEYFLANASDGSEFACFRVDATGSVSESFSNQTAPNSMAQKLNSASQGARDMKINMAGGNIDPWGISKAVLDGVGTILSTGAGLLQLSGLAAFAGNAFVDIPDNWESHSASMPETSYTMTLISPYGNPVSQMFNIYLPLCMLLAGALPLATGKQSYQSPFLCELFDRGHKITRLGVISSLSITRGTSNLAFNRDGQAMAIDITFTVKDLSSIVAMPIQQGSSVMPLEGIFDGETNYTDYLLTLGGNSLREIHDRLPTLMRQLDTKMANINSYFSMSRLMMDMGQSPVGVLASIFMKGASKD
jgi:hypothetical protein